MHTGGEVQQNASVCMHTPRRATPRQEGSAAAPDACALDCPKSSSLKFVIPDVTSPLDHSPSGDGAVNTLPCYSFPCSLRVTTAALAL